MVTVIHFEQKYRYSIVICMNSLVLKSDYNILLFANEDAKKFIDSKEYLNNEYYKDLAQNLNITD